MLEALWMTKGGAFRAEEMHVICFHEEAFDRICLCGRE